MVDDVRLRHQMNALVIIPTYNERENIAAITTAVLHCTPPHVQVLVVDDNSPDGTSQIVAAHAARDPRLHLLSRPRKEGLGPAYIAAFQWGLDRGYDVLVEMDADFSHRPQDLLRILDRLADADFVVGSRWVEDGDTVNWGVGRQIISRGGSLYARLILGHPLTDWTGGFNAWHARVLSRIGLDNVRSDGYAFQIELKYRSLSAGFRGVEVPIVFEDRRVGKSKMSMRIVVEALWRVWAIRCSS